MKTLILSMTILLTAFTAHAEPACEMMLQCQMSYRFPLGTHHYYDTKISEPMTVQLSKTHPDFPEIKLNKCYAELQYNDPTTELSFLAQAFNQSTGTSDSNSYGLQISHETDSKLQHQIKTDATVELSVNPNAEMTDRNGRILSNVMLSCKVKKISN